MELNKEAELEKLNEFIFYIDDTIDELRRKAEEQGYRLDLSTDSLKDLAKFIRLNKITNDEEHIDDFFASWVYLGEVFRLQAKGARWTVGIDDPKNLNYGQNYLTGYNDIGSEFIPMIYITNFVLSPEDRLDNNFLYETIGRRLNPKPVNLDHLPTEDGT